jgi:hypothetical protein
MSVKQTASGAHRRFVVGGLVALILAVLSTGVLATLNASAFNTTPQRAEAGRLSLVLANNGAGFSQGLTNLAPGDVVQRYVDLTNNGTLGAQGLTFAVTSSASNALTVDGTTTRALRVAVNACSGTWNPTTGACNGTVTPLLAATPVGSLATARELLTTAFPAGAVTRLQVVSTLPDQDEVTTNGAAPATTVQGLSTNLTYTFTQRQRSASVTNG